MGVVAPLPPLVDQRNEDDGHVEQTLRKGREAIEHRVGPVAVQQLRRTQREQTLRLVVRNRDLEREPKTWGEPHTRPGDGKEQQISALPWTSAGSPGPLLLGICSWVRSTVATVQTWIARLRPVGPTNLLC